MADDTLTQRVELALAQSKTVLRQARIQVQMLGALKDEVENLQSEGTQGEVDDTDKEDRS